MGYEAAEQVERARLVVIMHVNHNDIPVAEVLDSGYAEEDNKRQRLLRAQSGRAINSLNLPGGIAKAFMDSTNLFARRYWVVDK